MLALGSWELFPRRVFLEFCLFVVLGPMGRGLWGSQPHFWWSQSMGRGLWRSLSHFWGDLCEW